MYFEAPVFSELLFFVGEKSLDLLAFQDEGKEGASSCFKYLLFLSIGPFLAGGPQLGIRDYTGILCLCSQIHSSKVPSLTTDQALGVKCLDPTDTVWILISATEYIPPPWVVSSLLEFHSKNNKFNCYPVITFIHLIKTSPV